MIEDAVETAHDVPFAMTGKTQVPAPRYYDPAFARLENERLWSRTWQMACRLEEIPEPGDYVVYTIGDQSLMVIRLDGETVRAYHNVCRHRGTQLAVGSGSFRGGQIACPFHGWRWNLDGTNAFVYGQEGFSDHTGSDDICLPQVQVGTWGACVWVNLDPDAPPLLEAFDPMPSLLDPLGVDLMRVEWWKAVDLPANWKLAMEAFIEGYHVMASHPQITQGQHDDAYPADSLAYEVHAGGHSHYINRPGAQRTHRRKVDYYDEVEALIESSRLLSEGLEAMTLPRDLAVIETLRDRDVPEDASLGSELVKAIYEQAEAARIPLPRLKADGLVRWGGVFFVFPNYFVLPQYANALCYRFRPVHGDPERCLLELWSVTIPPEGSEVARPFMQGPFAPDDAEHWPLIPRQDFSNITRQQKGVHNRTFETTRISHVYEVGIANLHQEIDRYLALPPPRAR